SYLVSLYSTAFRCTLVFFFSSRRRHTRSKRDWSSDVCSSDLTAVRYEGEILFEGENLLQKPLFRMRDIRGNQISVIFQDPLNSLSPVHTVGNQISEVLILHKQLSKEEAGKRSIQMLKMTGIPDPEACMKTY